MFHVKAQSRVDVLLPVVEGLAREAKHQVDADILNPDIPQPFYSPSHFLSRMATMQEVQTVVGESLCPHADTIDRQSRQHRCVVLGDVVRIAFYGRLLQISQTECVADSVKQPV